MGAFFSRGASQDITSQFAKQPTTGNSPPSAYQQVPARQQPKRGLTRELRKQQENERRMKEEEEAQWSAIENERKYEREDKQKNLAGVSGDLVLIYPIESHEEEKQSDLNTSRFQSLIQSFTNKSSAAKQRELVAITQRQYERAQTIARLRSSRLTVVKSRSNDGKLMYVKVSATLERLEEEAERQGLEMLVSSSVVAREKARELSPASTTTKSALKQMMGGFMCRRFGALLNLIFGSVSQRTYRDYTSDGKDEFDRLGMGKEGRLFSPLERARIIFAIVEGDAERPTYGAQLDLDRLVAEGMFTTFLFLHSKGHTFLRDEWGAMGKIGLGLPVRVRLLINDIMCWTLYVSLILFFLIYISNVLPESSGAAFDIGIGGFFLTCIAVAAALGMLIQPLDDVRDYFGEKIAFYFGWLEHYTRYLIFLAFGSLVIVVFEVVKQDNRDQACASANVTGVACQALKDLEGASATGNDVVAYASLAYCLVVAVWTTLFQEDWKRGNAVLAHVWDVERFEENEDPRPEYLANFYHGRWRGNPEQSAEATATEGSTEPLDVAAVAATKASGAPVARAQVSIGAASAGSRPGASSTTSSWGNFDSPSVVTDVADAADKAVKAASEAFKLNKHKVLRLVPRGPMEVKTGFYTADGRFIQHVDGKKHKVFSYWYRLEAYARAVPSLLFMSLLMLFGALASAYSTPRSRSARLSLQQPPSLRTAFCAHCSSH